MADRWPPAASFFGLHVDCGFYHVDLDKWLRPPVARFTCRHGGKDVAVGAADVADFTKDLGVIHAQCCPLTPKESAS